MNTPKERQQWIYDGLMVNPLLSYGEMFTNYLQTFTNLSRQTFNKDWKKATQRHKEDQQAINKAKLEERIKIEKQAVKRQIIDKNQALEILSEIAQGKVKKVQDTILIPTYTDRTRAITEIAKFEGWYEPIKTENVHNVKEMPPSVDELIEILKNK